MIGQTISHSIVIVLAVAILVVNHYVFSFQRFTLNATRMAEVPITNTAEIQTLMTPGFMGALGWATTIGLFLCAGLLWLFLNWMPAVIYGFIHLAVGGFAPLISLKWHYRRLASGELARHLRSAHDSETYEFLEMLSEIVLVA